MAVDFRVTEGTISAGRTLYSSDFTAPTLQVAGAVQTLKFRNISPLYGCYLVRTVKLWRLHANAQFACFSRRSNKSIVMRHTFVRHMLRRVATFLTEAVCAWFQENYGRGCSHQALIKKAKLFLGGGGGWRGDIYEFWNVSEPSMESNVYWTVHHCDSWWMKDQLEVTCYFISLLKCSTCFGH